MGGSGVVWRAKVVVFIIVLCLCVVVCGLERTTEKDTGCEIRQSQGGVQLGSRLVEVRFLAYLSTRVATNFQYSFFDILK